METEQTGSTPRLLTSNSRDRLEPRLRKKRTIKEKLDEKKRDVFMKDNKKVKQSKKCNFREKGKFHKTKTFRKQDMFEVPTFLMRRNVTESRNSLGHYVQLKAHFV